MALLKVFKLFPDLLRRRIEGAPNFRRVPMVLHSGNSSLDEESDFAVEKNGKMVCGRSVISTDFFRSMYITSCVLVECQRWKGNYRLPIFLDYR